MTYKTFDEFLKAHGSSKEEYELETILNGNQISDVRHFRLEDVGIEDIVNKYGVTGILNSFIWCGSQKKGIFWGPIHLVWNQYLKDNHGMTTYEFIKFYRGSEYSAQIKDLRKKFTPHIKFNEELI